MWVEEQIDVEQELKLRVGTRIPNTSRKDGGI
jgi:hypothetical protein